MDTKRLEQIGELFIISRLLEEGILVAKPYFEQKGADLIGFKSFDDKARFCRIQCKYRELKKITPLDVNTEYVVGSFILFIYIKCDGKRHFYCLLPRDIHNIFKRKNRIFYLAITRKVLTILDNKASIQFTQSKISDISKLMKSSSPDAEYRRMFSGLVKKTKRFLILHRKREKLQKKIDRLGRIINQIKFLDKEIKANDEKIKILKEYTALMNKYIKLKRKRAKDG
jgi:hypothetical protein